jgi:hypothetical protein
MQGRVLTSGFAAAVAVVDRIDAALEQFASRMT